MSGTHAMGCCCCFFLSFDFTQHERAKNAAGECAGDWFTCMGFMKTWMFSLSGSGMALKRPQASEPVHRAIV